MSHMTAQFQFSALQNSERKDITVSCFPCLCVRVVLRDGAVPAPRLQRHLWHDSRNGATLHVRVTPSWRRTCLRSLPDWTRAAGIQVCVGR